MSRRRVALTAPRHAILATDVTEGGAVAGTRTARAPRRPTFRPPQRPDTPLTVALAIALHNRTGYPMTHTPNGQLGVWWVHRASSTWSASSGLSVPWTTPGTSPWLRSRPR